jgi:hypothetical protein
MTRDIKLFKRFLQLLIFLQAPHKSCESMQFMQVFGSLDMLEDTLPGTTVTSNIHCAHFCSQQFDGDRCTGFTMNLISSQCTCGKKSKGVWRGDGVLDTIYVNTKCDAKGI